MASFYQNRIFGQSYTFAPECWTNEAFCGLYTVDCDLRTYLTKSLIQQNLYESWVHTLPSSSLHKVRPKWSIIGFNLQIMVLENGPKFHKNGQMAFINTFPIFFLFLDFYNMFNCSTSTLDQNETFLRVNSSAMLMWDQVTLKIIWILWKIKFHGICAKCTLQWKIIFHKFYGQ